MLRYRTGRSKVQPESLRELRRCGKKKSGASSPRALVAQARPRIKCGSPSYRPPGAERMAFWLAWSRSQLASAIIRCPPDASLGILAIQASNESAWVPEAALGMAAEAPTTPVLASASRSQVSWAIIRCPDVALAGILARQASKVCDGAAPMVGAEEGAPLGPEAQPAAMSADTARHIMIPDRYVCIELSSFLNESATIAKGTGKGKRPSGGRRVLVRSLGHKFLLGRNLGENVGAGLVDSRQPLSHDVDQPADLGAQ